MIKRVDVPVRVNEMSVSGWLGDEKPEEAEGSKEGRSVPSEDGPRANGSAHEDRQAERSQDMPQAFPRDRGGDDYEDLDTPSRVEAATGLGGGEGNADAAGHARA